jgi:hypothetical protein
MISTPTLPAVQLYPTPAGAVPSGFAVLAGVAAPFVERWRDVSYTRFAIAGAIPIEIRTPAPARDVRVLPRAAVSDLATEGNLIRFALLRPANLVVLAAEMERLFLLVDPAETEPPVPGAPGVVTVVTYGADPTGNGIATTMLQQAIDEMAARPGGGTVLVPEGTFLTGTLTIRSRVTLYLAPGAVLRGSPDPADYPIDAGRQESGSDTSIASADERYRGETMTFSRLLLFDGAEDAHLVGRGTIDGNGGHLRKARDAVPNLVRVRAGHGVTIRDVLLRDAAAWTVHVLGARQVTIENVKIINDRSNLNTDGVDPDASQDVAVRGCLIYTKDDGVCVKATNNSDLGADVERVEVTGNVVSSFDAALKVGTESQAARFHDVVFRDNDVFDSERAMSIVVRDGATYADLVFRDIRVAPGVRHLIEQVIGVRQDRRPTLGRIERLTFENVEAPGYRRPASNWTWYAQFRPGGETGDDVPVFRGADASHALRGLVLRNVVVNGVRLHDRAGAERVANLTIGRFVEDVTIE